MIGAGGAEAAPIRGLAARLLTYRGQTSTYSSLSALFQGLCGALAAAGTLPGVYPVLAGIKHRILNQGSALSVDDVFAVAGAHNASSPGDPAAVSGLRVVLSVPGTGERLGYHREFVGNLRVPHQPRLTLNTEALGEVLGLVLQPKLYSADEQRELLDLDFSPGEQLGLPRILDTLYRATFSRTIRKELCGPTVHFPLAENSFHLLVDLKKTAHLTLPLNGLLRPFCGRLYRSPDLAAVLGADDRVRGRVQDGLRLLTGALHDRANLAVKRQEAAAVRKEFRSDDGETLEEL